MINPNWTTTTPYNFEAAGNRIYTAAITRMYGWIALGLVTTGAAAAIAYRLGVLNNVGLIGYLLIIGVALGLLIALHLTVRRAPVYHTTHYDPYTLPLQPQRHRMAAPETSAAVAQTRRATHQVPPPGNRQRRPLHPPHRRRLAYAAPRPAALPHRLSLLSHLAAGRRPAAGQRCPVPANPAASGPPSRTQRRHYRQPVGENHRKRGPHGYDAGKKVIGRKRHIVVDTSGLLLSVAVHPADVQDRDGTRLALGEQAGRFPRLRLIWADGGYRGAALSEWVQERLGCRLEIVSRRTGQRGFAVQPRRWVVERTFGWLGRQRRLSKDYEALPASGAAWVRIAMSRLVLRRLARNPAF